MQVEEYASTNKEKETHMGDGQNEIVGSDKAEILDQAEGVLKAADAGVPVPEEAVEAAQNVIGEELIEEIVAGGGPLLDKMEQEQQAADSAGGTDNDLDLGDGSGDNDDGSEPPAAFIEAMLGDSGNETAVAMESVSAPEREILTPDAPQADDADDADDGIVNLGEAD